MTRWNCSSCGNLASCPACVQRNWSNILGTLPDFPREWPEPYVYVAPNGTAASVCWATEFGDEEEDEIVMSPQEARGIARRLLLLADEAERNQYAREKALAPLPAGKLLAFSDEKGTNE